MRTIGHFIGGKHVAGTSGRFGDVFQPMTGEIIGKVALGSTILLMMMVLLWRPSGLYPVARR